MENMAAAPLEQPPPTAATTLTPRSPNAPVRQPTSGSLGSEGVAKDPSIAKQRQRSIIARQVSQRNLQATSQPLRPLPIPSAHSLTAKRLAQQAASAVAKAQDHAKRGMVHSARTNALEALRLIAEANDLLDGGVDSTTRLTQARTALREVTDFTGRFGTVQAETIARMTQSHETPVLRNCRAELLNGPRAVEIYLDYAREQLAAVAMANPIATNACVVLAKVEAAAKPEDSFQAAVAICLLRAALQARPDDAYVANELGYQLLQQSLLDEAEWVLQHSFQLQPSKAAGFNLAETLRQQGKQAQAQAIAARASDLPESTHNPVHVFTLSPQEFATLSPPQTSVPQTHAGSSSLPSPASGQGPMPTPAPEPRPATEQSPGPLGRVANAVSRLWK